jgi:nucleoside-diphosphate-sugar epimerase
MAQAHPGVRAVRISNVIDPGFTSPTFLSMIVREAIRNGSVTIGTSACSAKDYLPVSRLLPMLELVATRGTSRLYNLASGQAVSNALIAKLVHEVFGCPVTFAGDAVDVRFPAISTSRFRSEFGGKSVHLETELRQAMQNLKLSINE